MLYVSPQYKKGREGKERKLAIAGLCHMLGSVLRLGIIQLNALNNSVSHYRHFTEQQTKVHVS